eukprot:Awhi_evm1s11407
MDKFNPQNKYSNEYDPTHTTLGNESNGHDPVEHPIIIITNDCVSADVISAQRNNIINTESSLGDNEMYSPVMGRNGLPERLMIEENGNNISRAVIFNESGYISALDASTNSESVTVVGSLSTNSIVARELPRPEIVDTTEDYTTLDPPRYDYIDIQNPPIDYDYPEDHATATDNSSNANNYYITPIEHNALLERIDANDSSDANNYYITPVEHNTLLARVGVNIPNPSIDYDYPDNHATNTDNSSDANNYYITPIEHNALLERIDANDGSDASNYYITPVKHNTLLARVGVTIPNPSIDYDYPDNHATNTDNSSNANNYHITPIEYNALLERIDANDGFDANNYYITPVDHSGLLARAGVNIQNPSIDYDYPDYRATGTDDSSNANNYYITPIEHNTLLERIDVNDSSFSLIEDESPQNSFPYINEQHELPDPSSNPVNNEGYSYRESSSSQENYSTDTVFVKDYDNLDENSSAIDMIYENTP